LLSADCKRGQGGWRQEAQSIKLKLLSISDANISLIKAHFHRRSVRENPPSLTSLGFSTLCHHQNPFSAWLVKKKHRLIRVRLMRLLWHSYSQIFTYFTAKIIIYLTMTGDCRCFLLLAVHIHCVPRAFSKKLTPTILKMAD
jgi:hypothetical protein